MKKWEFPYIALLEVHYNDTIRAKTGVILSREYIVTVLKSTTKPDYIDCHFGIIESTDRYLSMRVLKNDIYMKDITANDYDDALDDSLIVVLTLVRLPERLTFKNIKPVVVPQSNTEHYHIIGEVAGFGRTTDEDSDSGEIQSNGILTKAYFKVLTDPECTLLNDKLVSKYFKHDYYCIQPVNPNTGICPGDEGSALVLSRQGKFQLIGILVRTFTSCEAEAVMYRVNRKLDWIEKVMFENKHNERGTKTTDEEEKDKKKAAQTTTTVAVAPSAVAPIKF